MRGRAPAQSEVFASSRKYRHKAFLWGMYVVPQCRGGGVAQELMHAALAWAKKQPDIIAISLQVAVSNTRGQRFYRHFGFTIFGTEQRSLFASGEFHDVHYMVKDEMARFMAVCFCRFLVPHGSGKQPLASSWLFYNVTTFTQAKF